MILSIFIHKYISLHKTLYSLFMNHFHCYSSVIPVYTRGSKSSPVLFLVGIYQSHLPLIEGIPVHLVKLFACIHALHSILYLVLCSTCIILMTYSVLFIVFRLCHSLHPIRTIKKYSALRKLMLLITTTVREAVNTWHDWNPFALTPPPSSLPLRVCA